MFYPEQRGGHRDVRSWLAPGRWHHTDAATNYFHQFGAWFYTDPDFGSPVQFFVYGDWGSLNGEGWTMIYTYASRIVLVPFVLPVAGRLARIGAAANNLSTTETIHVRLGLYRASNYPTDAYAHELIVDAGDCEVAPWTMANSSPIYPLPPVYGGATTARWAGGRTYLQPAVDVRLQPGLYWIAMGFPSTGPALWTTEYNSGVTFSYWRLEEYVPQMFGQSPIETYHPAGLRMNQPSALGARAPGVFHSGSRVPPPLAYRTTMASTGYHMAYPNTAVYTSAQGALPTTLSSPSGDIDSTHALFIAAPILSLQFASFQPDTTASGSSGAPGSAAFVTLGAETNLTAERRLVAGSGIELVDQGGNQPLTVNATAYGDLDGGTW